MLQEPLHTHHSLPRSGVVEELPLHEDPGKALTVVEVLAKQRPHMVHDLIFVGMEPVRPQVVGELPGLEARSQAADVGLLLDDPHSHPGLGQGGCRAESREPAESSRLYSSRSLISKMQYRTDLRLSVVIEFLARIL